MVTSPVTVGIRETPTTLTTRRAPDRVGNLLVLSASFRDTSRWIGSKAEKQLRATIVITAWKYMERGFPIFLAHVTTKEIEDKSEKKRLEDVPIVQNFPEVFHEELRVFLRHEVEFQN
ncbi:hypothetical protein Tco_0012327 [Tanacetum coccineum]